jgi:hypothetical protein
LRIKVKGRLTEKTAFCPSCSAPLSGSVPQGDGLPALEKPERPSRSCAGIVLAVLALGMGVAAMPAALAIHEHLGLALAGLGLLLGVVGMFTAVLRGRGAGFGLSLAGTAVCGSVLVVSWMLFTKGVLPDAHQPQADAAKKDNGGGAVTDEQPAPNAGSGSRPDSPDGIANKKVADLVRDLMSERNADRIRAAEQLGKLKEEGRPAARALCEAAVSPDQPVRQAALEALEKVHPSLYKSVLTLIVDSNWYNHVQAAQAIGAMGEDGRPAAPVLLAHIKWLTQSHSGRPDGVFAGQFFSDDPVVADIAALREIAPNEEATARAIIGLTASGEEYGGAGWKYRKAAATALGDLAKAQPRQRPAMVKALVAATDYHYPRTNAIDRELAIAAMTSLGRIGPDAQVAIAQLKKLKLSSDATIRQAASAALEKIEPQR